MTQPSGTQITELMDQISNHKWTRAQIEWKSLGRVYRAYQRNAAELLLAVTDPERDPELALRIMDEDQSSNVRDDYFDELFRHFHNYLAAVKTLVDHSRALVNRYPNTQFWGEYQKRKNDIKSMPVTGFLHRLRDCMLHARFPPLQVNMHWSAESNETTFAVTLDREALLAWGDDWTKGPRKFISSKDPLVIREAVEEYADAIEGLYQ